jgi:hypothetical protein
MVLLAYAFFLKAIGGKPLFGLPGNPVSTMISFEPFIRPAILKMRGFTNLFRRSVKAVMMEDYSKKSGLKYFIRGRIEIRDGRYYVTTTGEQGSGILKSMVKATGLIMLPEDVTFVKAGDEVKVQLLSNFLDLGTMRALRETAWSRRLGDRIANTYWLPNFSLERSRSIRRFCWYVLEKKLGKIPASAAGTLSMNFSFRNRSKKAAARNRAGRKDSLPYFGIFAMYLLEDGTKARRW